MRSYKTCQWLFREIRIFLHLFISLLMKIRKRKLILPSTSKSRRSLLQVQFFPSMILISINCVKWSTVISNPDFKYLRMLFATLTLNLDKLSPLMTFQEVSMDSLSQCRQRIKKVCLLTWLIQMALILYWWHLNNSVGYMKSQKQEILIHMNFKHFKSKFQPIWNLTNKKWNNSMK